MYTWILLRYYQINNFQLKITKNRNIIKLLGVKIYLASIYLSIKQYVMVNYAGF